MMGPPGEGTGEGARVRGLVDHLFRRQAGRMVAMLTRALGPAHLGLAEEVVQESLIQALRRWPFHGVPDNPSAWLYRVARNLSVDRLRRDTTFRAKESAIRDVITAAPDRAPAVSFPGEVTDDQLRLIFLCCHPDLPRDGRVALTLRAACGFGVAEIARGFLAKEATIAQRLVRAQRRIRERGIPFEVPGPAELPARLEAVLEVLYLMFNEGYTVHDGDALIRADLCDEALRLSRCLAAMPLVESPAAHALASLLHFQASRLPARLDDAGELVLLSEQDRSRWDQAKVRQAFLHLEHSAAGEEITPYHLQAAIAAHHARAGSDDDTDWPAILTLYDQLLARFGSPVVALNRAVAVAQVHGPERGLQAVDEIAGEPALDGYYLLPATRAALLARTEQPQRAAALYREALARRCSEPERRFLERKLREL